MRSSKKMNRSKEAIDSALSILKKFLMSDLKSLQRLLVVQAIYEISINKERIKEERHKKS